MKLMALADIHGHVKVIPLLADAARDCDVIVLAGDMTDFGDSERAVSVLTALKGLGKPVLGVSGNCDPPEVDKILEQENVSVMQKPVEINGVFFTGFSYPASKASILPMERFLRKPIILVSHQPAWGTDVDLQAGTRHKGSRTIRSFIEDYQPLLALSGHIHEARGTDRIGSTVLVNPGSFRNGCYATIDLNGDMAQATLHTL